MLTRMGQESAKIFTILGHELHVPLSSSQWISQEDNTGNLPVHFAAWKWLSSSAVNQGPELFMKSVTRIMDSLLFLGGTGIAAL